MSDSVRPHTVETIPLTANGAVWHLCSRCGRGGYTPPPADNECEAKR